LGQQPKTYTREHFLGRTRARGGGGKRIKAGKGLTEKKQRKGSSSKTKKKSHGELKRGGGGKTSKKKREKDCCEDSKRGVEKRSQRNES